MWQRVKRGVIMLLVPIFQPEEFNGKLYTEYGYVLKQFAKYMAEVDKLQAELEKTHNQLMEVEKDAQEKIAELKSELEVKDDLLKIKNGLCGNDIELPCDPILAAKMLINAKIEYEPTSLQKALFKTEGKCLADKYSNDDLEQIAEHLLVYCKHNRGDEE